MTPLMRMVSHITLFVALLISATHIAGADEGPGDGFTAGVISALAFTLQYIVHGRNEAPGWLRHLRFEFFVAAGLIVALLAAVLPLAAGRPFLAHMEVLVPLAGLGALRLTRALLFDIGVYLIVFGSAMTAIEQLGREAR